MIAPFQSKHYKKIWDGLYKVLIPDQLTLNPDYVRIYGTYSSGDKEVDKMMASQYTEVMISIARMLDYYEQGVVIKIPKRETMLRIHDNIELYLDEWETHMKTSMHSTAGPFKNLLIGLEKMSKELYSRASRQEVEGLTGTKDLDIGIKSPLLFEKTSPSKKKGKPEYRGISALVREQARNNK